MKKLINTALTLAKTVDTIIKANEKVQTVPAKIGDNLTVDVVMSKEVTFESTVSENPVETGFVISDHVHRKPLKLTLDAVFTPTSMTGGGQLALGLFGRTGTNSTGRLTNVFNSIMQIYKDGAPVRVTLPDNIYENMVLVAAPLPRRAEDGICYRSQLEFQQVIVVSAKTETVPEETADEDVEEMAGDSEEDFGEAEIEELNETANEEQPIVETATETIYNTGGGGEGF